MYSVPAADVVAVSAANAANVKDSVKQLDVCFHQTVYIHDLSTTITAEPVNLPCLLLTIIQIPHLRSSIAWFTSSSL